MRYARDSQRLINAIADAYDPMLLQGWPLLLIAKDALETLASSPVSVSVRPPPDIPRPMKKPGVVPGLCSGKSGSPLEVGSVIEMES